MLLYRDRGTLMSCDGFSFLDYNNHILVKLINKQIIIYVDNFYILLLNDM